MWKAPINEAPGSLGSRWHVRDLVVTYQALSWRYWLLVKPLLARAKRSVAEGIGSGAVKAMPRKSISAPPFNRPADVVDQFRRQAVVTIRQ